MKDYQIEHLAEVIAAVVMFAIYCSAIVGAIAILELIMMAE